MAGSSYPPPGWPQAVALTAGELQAVAVLAAGRVCVSRCSSVVV